MPLPRSQMAKYQTRWASAQPGIGQLRNPDVVTTYAANLVSLRIAWVSLLEQTQARARGLMGRKSYCAAVWFSARSSAWSWAKSIRSIEARPPFGLRHEFMNVAFTSPSEL